MLKFVGLALLLVWAGAIAITHKAPTELFFLGTIALLGGVVENHFSRK
jgi:hypothetical protein